MPRDIHKETALKVLAFLQSIDWSASSEEWKRQRIAEILRQASDAQLILAERKLLEFEVEWDGDKYVFHPYGVI